MSQIIKPSVIARELRVHFCKTNPGSQGLRDFIGKEYLNLKKEHPGLPILIREAQGVESRVFGRYDKGVERKAILDNLSAAEVEKTIKDLIRG
ncbi:hypothetical protein DSO57_1008548 [Entomophthora muscae]|uniref:Uncharacterized protein n=1 Tax=Entomophthora muscae TaxID=34485 RepID=A0ACC2UU41_9FUNG|nr:hypothetical protein DSO57_1008548 [Entomophthora muscae]